MIVIGVDTHKRTHALAAVDAGTGRVRGQRQIKAEEQGHLAAVRWARGLDEERVWAIEDCRHVSRRLEQALLAAGERVVRVPPHRMGASRRGEREPGKSDEIDALAIARAVVKDGIEKFPVAYLDEAAMDIRLLLDHRNDLVAERTRTVNRLRWHLLQLSPELERSLKPGSLNQPRVLDRVDRRLRRLPAGARVRVAREQVAQIRSLNRRTDELKRELVELVKAHRPQLLAETGCGPLTAAILIGRTAGAERFRSDASFALQSGTAPIPCSSASVNSTGSIAAATVGSTTRCTSSRSPAPATTRPPRPSWNARKPKARPPRERCAASSATSPDASTSSCPKPPSQIPAPRRKSPPIPAGATAAASTRASPAPPQPRCPA
jgi:transposase